MAKKHLHLEHNFSIIKANLEREIYIREEKSAPTGDDT